MAKRPAMVLGIGGALVPPGPNPCLQWQFLEAVKRKVPEAYQELARIAHAPPTPSGLRRGQYEQREPMRAWLTKWGFSAAPWLKDVAHGTAAQLRKNPTRTAAFGWVFTTGYWGVEAPAAPAGWDIDVETEAQYDARVRAYKATVLAAAHAAGWGDPPVKRSAEHVEWFALHHVGGWTEARIAVAYQDRAGRPDVPAVSRAIGKTARLLGVTLRPTRGRRPLT